MYFTRTAISHKGKWKFYSELERVYPDNYTHLLMPFSALNRFMLKGTEMSSNLNSIQCWKVSLFLIR